MKKKLTIFVMIIFTFVMIGCKAKIDIYEKLSEITTIYFVGDTTSANASISVGERERDYVIDGKSGERTDFSLVVVRFFKQPNQEQVETLIKVNGEEKPLVLYFNPMSNVYMNDLGYALEDNDEITLSYQDIVIDFQCLNFEIDYNHALRIALKAMSNDFQANMKNGELDGECYLKVLSSYDNNDKFWLFTFVNSHNETKNLLINVQNGKIIEA